MIRDQYTHAPLSRQRKYQLRMRDARKCIKCGELAVNATFCEAHAIIERQRALINYHKAKTKA